MNVARSSATLRQHHSLRLSASPAAAAARGRRRRSAPRQQQPAAAAAASARAPLTPSTVMSELALDPCTDASPCSLCQIAGWRTSNVLATSLNENAAAAPPPWERMFSMDAPLQLLGPLPRAGSDGGSSSSGGSAGFGGAISRADPVPPGVVVDIGGGAQAVVVASPADVAAALEWLDADPWASSGSNDSNSSSTSTSTSTSSSTSRSSSRPPLALDLEWLANTGARRRSRGIAVVQLASSPLRCCLFHTAEMGFALPPELAALLTGRAGRTLLTQGWDHSDAHMLRASFGLGVEQGARHIIDLQGVSGRGMGYAKTGLVALGKGLLHASFTKSRKQAMSNWERRQLTGAQVKYAALDVLVPHGIYGALAALHARAMSPAAGGGTGGTGGAVGACSACGQPFGAQRRVDATYACAHPGCDAGPLPLRSVMGHCITMEHAPGVVEDECGACGRMFARRATEADIDVWRRRCEKRKERMQQAEEQAAAAQLQAAEC